MELIKTLFDTLMSTNKALVYMHAGTFILVFIHQKIQSVKCSTEQHHI